MRSSFAPNQPSHKDLGRRKLSTKAYVSGVYDVITQTTKGEAMKRIIRNAIRCNNCGDVIESKHRHDYNTCSCKRVAVDGGMDYLRRSFTNNRDDYTELSEYIDDTEDEVRNNSGLG